MEKVVYSMVLSKHVVEAVDDLAAREGKSRSAMINHILAEYTSMLTPEKQTEFIVQAIQEYAYERFHKSTSTNGTLTLKTTLRYRYNPAISYIIEVGQTKNTIGNLSVATRTTNEQLQNKVESFFAFWNTLEEENLHIKPTAVIGNDKTKQYKRDLRVINGLESVEQQGEAIAGYVNLLDDCLKKFFEDKRSMQVAQQGVRQFYESKLPYLKLALDL